jgi:hypothetical protein
MTPILRCIRFVSNSTLCVHRSPEIFFVKGYNIMILSALAVFQSWVSFEHDPREKLFSTKIMIFSFFPVSPSPYDDHHLLFRLQTQLFSDQALQWDLCDLFVSLWYLVPYEETRTSNGGGGDGSNHVVDQQPSNAFRCSFSAANSGHWCG